MTTPRTLLVVVMVIACGFFASPAGGQREPVVLNERIELQWLDAERAWYRRDRGPGEREYILIDAGTGERSLLFDHEQLAKQLSERLGRAVGPHGLPIDHLELDDSVLRMLVRGEASLLVADRDTLVLREAEPDDLAAVGRSLVADPGASRSGGAETAVLLHNATDQPVRMVWIDTAGQQREYDTVQPGATHRQHTFAGHSWLFIAEDDTKLGGIRAGRTTNVIYLTEREDDARTAIDTAPSEARLAEPRRRGVPDQSPDGRWAIEIRDHNVLLRKTDTDEVVRLTEDGDAENRYVPRVHWSPDSSRVVVMRTQRGDERRVYYVEAAPRDQLQPKLHSYAYRKPGDAIPQTFPHLFNVEEGTEIEVDRALFDNPWAINNVGWSDDGERFVFTYNQRGHQVVRVVALDRTTGEARAVINEECKTFFDYSNKLYRRDVPPTEYSPQGEIIWMSERDGWNHLYLFDAGSGALINQITRGEWVVRRVDRVDDEARQIWFRAMGIHPQQDPYHVHFARINFDGSGLSLFTDGDGTHEIESSPDGSYLVARYSRVDLPSVTELRCAEHGTLITEIERAMMHPAPEETSWHLPTRFVAKGRDGVTDIHGMILWPRDFDESQKYPVIESIYAGPHGAHVPKSFRVRYGHRRELTDLGFIVVMIDGMGTNWRNKAFHDHCWKNIADAGFPDRVRWLRAAGERYPSFDLERVGIYGGSAGGQNAMRALIDHHDMYKVAVADCGCHDNRIDKIWWNEAWMGWPVDASYEDSSNVVHAHRMEGKLLLIVGEKDENVDPASTIQVVDALIRANKDFDFLLIPGAGHGAAETPYGRRMRREFFVRHLQPER